MRLRHFLAAGVLLATASLSSAALAAPPAGLRDLVGMRGSSLDNEMTNRGYRFIAARGAQYWWNGRLNICASVSIANGRVSYIDTVGSSQCGMGGGAQPGSTPQGLRDLIGMRGSSLENQMNSRGYRFVVARGPQYWWNDRADLCVAVSISDGRVSTITTAPRGQCIGNGPPPRPPGPPVGGTPPELRDLIGMRGSSLENQMNSRGYRFIVARGPQYWWNGRMNQCVAVSISQGRVASISTTPNGQCNGGGGPPPRPPGGGGNGLGGITGMDSIAAIDAMIERGFANVDDIRSGNTQYGIFYNRATRVCAQLTMANGRVLDARDIQTHPKCR